ncbi:MAG TPA: DUF4012 domain-containing protein [Acidimicrobiales bacterium]|nr:DUF4012 domain-containing protein [Acidimicrobiales bacterium]
MRRRLLLLAGVALVVWLAAAAFSLLRLASDLDAGNDAASAARGQLGAEQVAEQEPLPELRTAATRFAAAHDRAGGLVLAPLRVLPVIGRQLRSVDALSGAAATVADAGVDAVERAGVVFEDPAAAGRDRVEQVRELRDVIQDVTVRLDAIEDLGPVSGLLSPLADARNDLSGELGDVRRTLRTARAGADAALALVTGPRRYLVLAANNAEMRAGSGMWLQGGTLVTSEGDLELRDMVSLHNDADPPDGAVVATGDLASRWGFLNPGNEWRNLMASPRFPESAQLAVQMWRAAGRGEVDGVLAVDAIGLQAIVAATGPIETEAGTMDEDRIVRHLLHDQYLDLGDTIGQTGRANAERREGLAELATAAVAAIDAGDYPASTLIRTLGDAVAGRHLLAWSGDEVEQQGWEAAGMSGDLRSDSLLVSVLNRGGNKLDPYLEIDAALEVEPSRDGWDVTVELELTNTAPSGEPPYIAGPFAGLDLDAGEYRGILAVNVPGGARGAAFDDVEQLAVAGRDGRTRVVGFPLDLPRGASRVAVLRFRLRPGAEHLVVEPSSRVPGITWRYGSASWEDSASRTAKFPRG